MEEVVREASKRGSDGSLSVIRKCLQVRHTMRLYMGMYIYIYCPLCSCMTSYTVGYPHICPYTRPADHKWVWGSRLRHLFFFL